MEDSLKSNEPEEYQKFETMDTNETYLKKKEKEK